MEQAEKFLASLSEEGRYRLLVDAITDYAVYMLNPSGIVTSWNAGAQRFKGYQATDIIGQDYARFFTAADRDANVPRENLQRAMDEGRLEVEGWRVREDGTEFWAHCVVDPIRAPDGDIIGFAKITRDLSERKAATEALRQSDQQFRLLVQGVTDYAIYMLDPNGIVSSWNAGAQRIKGYLPEEIIGKHYSSFYTDEDRDAGEPAHNLALAAEHGRIEREGWRVGKDGRRFWAHVIIDAIRNEAGELIGFAKVTRDATERKKTEQELERTREALFQSQKMDAIGQLTGGVAHDFNNLLTVIVGSLGLLRKRLPADPRLTPLLDNSLRAAERGASLTQRMLAFARKQELEVVPVDIPELVRGVAEMIQRSLGPSIRIDTEFPLVLPAALTDSNQLEAALLNLTVNARDAMPRGGRLVISADLGTVTAAAGPLQPGSYVRLRVADSGEGMDAETLQRAAEPFFTTKGTGKGTGLGLSMVQGFAEQSGGQFLITSVLAEGTVAEIWLPAALSKDDGVGDKVYETPAVAEPAGYPLTILVVDDDPLVLMNTAAMLEDLGHSTVEAASAGAALDVLEAEPAIQLVITDYAMPGMTGAELAGVISASRPQLPIILATGYAELPAGSERGLQRIGKPFLQEDLTKAIERAIASHDPS